MRKNIIFILIITLFALLKPSLIFAVPLPPEIGINRQTKTCSAFRMGDECTVCRLPDGWQIIEESQCPAGYKQIQQKLVCTPIKNSHCCTIQHSGANGDCEDVVVNDTEKKCAFVEDINLCQKLPENWKQADEIKFWGRTCPSHEYKWLSDPLNCGSIKKSNYVVSDNPEQPNTIQITGISASIIILLIFLYLFLIKKHRN